MVPGTNWTQSNLAWAKRPSKGSAFADQGELVALNAPGRINDWPSISADGRELYFSSDRSGAEQIFVATRVSPGAAFGAPMAVPLDVQGHGVSDPEISADGKTLYVSVNESGETNIWSATRTCP